MRFSSSPLSILAILACLVFSASLASPVARTKAIDPYAGLTNGERFRRGLRPAPIRKATRARSALRPRTSAVVATFAGYVQILKADGTPAGFLSTGTSPIYGGAVGVVLTSSPVVPSDALRVTFTTTLTGPFKIHAENSLRQAPAYSYLGMDSLYFKDDISGYNPGIFTFGPATPPGGHVFIGDTSRGGGQKTQTAIWTLNPVSLALTPTWVNMDDSLISKTVYYDSSLNAVFLRQVGPDSGQVTCTFRFVPAV